MNSNRLSKKYKEALRECIKHGRLKILTDTTLSYYEESLDVFVKYYRRQQIVSISRTLNKILVENYSFLFKKYCCRRGLKDISDIFVILYMENLVKKC